MLLHMLLFGVFASIMLRFWGQICFKEAIMLVKHATLWSIFYLFIFLLFFWRSTSVKEAIMLLHMLLLGVFAFNYAPFLGVKYASKRRLCS